MKKKINWGVVISTLGIAALGAVSALWQSHADRSLMEETVRETMKQIELEKEENANG